MSGCSLIQVKYPTVSKYIDNVDVNSVKMKISHTNSYVNYVYITKCCHFNEWFRFFSIYILPVLMARSFELNSSLKRHIFRWRVSVCKCLSCVRWLVVAIIRHCDWLLTKPSVARRHIDCEHRLRGAYLTLKHSIPVPKIFEQSV